jgi:hypothetical protein
MALHPEPLLFAFEAESSENLTFIPMSVRFNLDRCGLRISLDDWQSLPHSCRAELARFPLVLCQLADFPQVDSPQAEDAAGDSFADALAAMLAGHGRPAPQCISPVSDPDWRRPDVPPQVVHQCTLAALTPPGYQAWQGLSEFQRYVLVKLSRKPAKNHDFGAAMHEFGLAGPLA